MPLSILKKSIALLYRKKGKELLSAKEMELMITMDFRWFSPGEAKAFVELAVNSGLVLKQKNGLKINFDWRELEIPLDFAPTEAIFEAASHRSCFTGIVDAIENNKKVPREDIVAEINHKQESMNVAIEIAAILVGAKYGVDLSGFYDAVEKELMARFGQ